jgi:hypothetical protein
MTRFDLLAFALLLATLAAPPAARAAQSYDNCTGTIASLPAVIGSAGTWCLKADLATSLATGAAITISTNDVTIDCNGFKLGGLGAGLATQAYGIAAVGRLNITVRRCNIRGFLEGVAFSGASSGNLVEDNRFDGNTYTALVVKGDGSVVRRNRIFDTGGTTVVSLTDAYGMYVVDSVDIIDNIISGVAAASGGNNNAFGICTTNAGGRIIGNGVRGLAKDGTGRDYAIANTDHSDRLSLRDNDLAGDASANSTGISCFNANGRAKDNTINGFATAISTCHDSGGNTVVP